MNVVGSILLIMQERDAEFRDKFCKAGTYIGAPDMPKCDSLTCAIPTETYMEFQHRYDQRIINVIQNSSHG